MKSWFFLLLCFFCLPSDLRGKGPSFKRNRVLLEEAPIPWDRPWAQAGLNIDGLLKILKTSPTGKKVYQKALHKVLSLGLSFSDVIKEGEVSLTDTTLVRTFSPKAPSDVSYQQKSVITVNRHLSVADAVADLAHELTHFNEREHPNPYKGVSWESFVRSTVEGKGGEVDAFLTECHVMEDIVPKNLARNSKCSHILDPQTGLYSRAKAIKEFYRLGKYYQHFHRRLQDFGLQGASGLPLSKKGELFLSAAYSLPYPVAAIEEYSLMMSQACANDQKRFQRLKDGPRAQYTRDFRRRCQNFLP